MSKNEQLSIRLHFITLKINVKILSIRIYSEDVGMAQTYRNNCKKGMLHNEALVVQGIKDMIHLLDKDL